LTPPLPKLSLLSLSSFKPLSSSLCPSKPLFSSLSSFLSASLAASYIFILPIASASAAALVAAALVVAALAVASSLYYLLILGLTPSLKALAYRRLN